MAVSEPENLSDIPTNWSDMDCAHFGPEHLAREAKERLLGRYETAIRRYLLGSLRNADAANEVYDEFEVRFLAGRFKSADPDRGKFRWFLKRSLKNLIMDHHRQRKRAHASIERNQIDPIDNRQGPAEERDREFARIWREEVIQRAWKALEHYEAEHGRPYYTLFRYRVENPNIRSPELAALFAPRYGRELSAGAVRKHLRNARALFADLLVHDVAQSVSLPTRQHVEQELIDLELLVLCVEALDRRFAPRE